MLPPTFIVDKRNSGFSDYICDKCKKKVPQTAILDMFAQDEKEWAMLESNACCDVSKYKEILEKQRKIFHEGHANIVRVKALMVKRIANSLKQISNELLIEYMRYCKEVAQSLKLLTPCEFQMYPFDARSLRSFSYFAYSYNIYFIHSQKKRARNMSVPMA